ncbi:Protein of unknown function [Pyronema omphalodes CBS 100304]|uniref:Uncharacterized protein n=1 Tax=Pyronema omphalodes (strain CBS 100304) TaxID=1076935 RepID=U4KTY2_PYROM|nr:Protein of unknown function [Pyronema omphalodes CBS 100304]
MMDEWEEGGGKLVGEKYGGMRYGRDMLDEQDEHLLRGGRWRKASRFRKLRRLLAMCWSSHGEDRYGLRQRRAIAMSCTCTLSAPRRAVLLSWFCASGSYAESRQYAS